MKVFNQIIISVLVLPILVICQSGLPESSAQKFNTRGIFDNSFVSQNGNEIVSDYDGNLLLQYSSSIDYADDLSGELSIIFNANVAHRIFDNNHLASGGFPNQAGYSSNAPEWIIGYKGIALQTLNFETNFYDDPSNYGTTKQSDYPRLIPGYNYTNKLDNNGQPYYSDNIHILRSDGSNIELQNVDQNTTIGLYVERGINNFGYAKVERQSGSNYLRNMWYNPGNGLVFYFEEEFVKYGDISTSNQTLNFPTVMYLKKIYSPINYVYFEYENASGTFDKGRKYFKRMKFGGTSVIHASTSYNYSGGFINHVTVSNNQKNLDYILTLDNTTSAYPLQSVGFQTNKSRSLRVSEIEDDLGRTDYITYNSSTTQQRKYRLGSPEWYIQYENYLPIQIEYHSGKRTTFEYYYQLFSLTAPDNSVTLKLDRAPQYNTTNMNSAWRDCFTNFMIDKRKFYNNFSEFTSEKLIKSENYSYEFGSGTVDDDDFTAEKIEGIRTSIVETNEDATNDTHPARTINKKFTKYNTSDIDYTTFDHGSTIKLIEVTITGTMVDEEDDYYDIKKYYEWEHNTTATTGSFGRKYYDGTFLQTSAKERKYNASSYIEAETNTLYGQSSHNFQNLNYVWNGSTKATKKIKQIQIVTDPTLFKTKTEYLNIIPSELSTYDLSTISTNHYFNIGLPEQITEYSEIPSLQKSKTKLEYYTTGTNAGLLETKTTNEGSNREQTASYYYGSDAGQSRFLTRIEDDKGLKTVFDYVSGTTTVQGTLLKYDGVESTQTFTHGNYQVKPFKTSIYINNQLLLENHTSYNPKGKIQFEIDPNGYYSDYTYDDLGRIETANFQGSFTSTVTPNTTGYSGGSYTKNSITYTYDDDDNILNITKSFIKDENDNSKIENKLEYDSFGQMIINSVKNSSGSYIEKLRKDYNHSGLVDYEEVGENYDNYFQYNYMGELTKNISKRESHHPPAPVVPEISAKIEYYWNNGSVQNGTTTKSYHEYIKYIDEEDRIRYEYFDKVGNKVAEKIGTLTPTIFNYNGTHQLVSVISPEGRTTSYSYDEFGNISERTTVDDTTYKYKYDKWGNLRFVFHTTANDGIVFHTYDELNRLVVTGKTSGNLTTFSGLNADIAQSFDTDESKMLIKNMYDKYNRTGAFDGLPSKTTGEIEDMNLLGKISATAYRDVESSSDTWSLKYFEYDHLGRVKKLNEQFYGESWRYVESKYDHIGNLVFQNINNQHFVWNEYDVEGRLSTVKSNSTNNEASAVLEASYSFNQADQITKIGVDEEVLDNLTISTTSSYEGPFIVATDVSVTSSGDLTLKARQGITLNSGFSVVVGGTFNATIDETIELGTSYGSTNLDYNGTFGWVSSIKNNSDGISERFKETLTYEDNGNINGQTIKNQGNSSWADLGFSYSYDAMNRLISANCTTNNTYDETYTYDDDGNFESRTKDITTFDYDYFSGTNKISDFNNQYGYTFDNKGNLSAKSIYGGSDIFTVNNYDHRNLPLSVWESTSGTINYKYDDAGNRVIKDVGATDEYYFHDQTGKQVAIYDISSNALKQVNLFGGNGLIGYVNKSSDERFYYVKDHLGSVRLTIDENSEIVSAKDYFAYGNVLRNINYGEEDKYDFTEKERDAETGLNYFGARYYDSDIGRWTSVDPLAEMRPGLSPYNYAQNNPLNRIDPTGMIDEDDDPPPGWNPTYPDVVVEADDPNPEYDTFPTFGDNAVYADHLLRDSENMEAGLGIDFVASTIKTFVSSLSPINPYSIHDMGNTTNMVDHLVSETLETLQKKGIAKTPAVRALVYSSVVDYVSDYLGPYNTSFRSGPTGDTTFYNYQQTNGLIMEVVSKHAINDSTNITLYEEFGF